MIADDSLPNLVSAIAILCFALLRIAIRTLRQANALVDEGRELSERAVSPRDALRHAAAARSEKRGSQVLVPRMRVEICG